MTKARVRVLLVEDNDHDAEIVKRMLGKYKRASFELDWVRSTAECVDRLKSHACDLVLLDYSLPDEDGLSFLRRLSSDGNFPPVIMLTGWGDARLAAEALRVGAYDYFPKSSIDSDILAQAIHSALQKYRLEREEQRLREELQRLAIIDDLTRLHNRRYLVSSLKKECRRALRYGHDLSCLMIDLDHFKAHNEAYGHRKGDALLRRVASVIAASVRETDVAARYGGDEFCLLLVETPREDARQTAERLRSAIATVQLVINGRPVSTTASIGIFTAETPQQLKPTILIEYADRALQAAKSAAKNRVCAYNPPVTASPQTSV